MVKLLLHSVLIMTIAIPMWFAKAKDPRAGMRKTVVGAALWFSLWVIFCAYVFLKVNGE